MQTSESGVSSARSAPLARIGLVAGLSAWVAYLLFQTGDLYDEAEHCHAAWLTSKGLRPLHDFFQHHQPLLWDVLRLYFAAGLHGPRVLLWGRIVVALCALATAAALLGLGRRWSQPGTWSPVPGISGVLYLIVASWVMPEYLVIRPETLALPLFLGGLLAWEGAGDRKLVRSLLAGVLFGAAVYATPRFLLLGGFFLLAGDAGRAWRRSDLRRFVALAAGSVLFIGAYTLIRGYPLQEVLFNIRFSAFLQSIADGPRGERLPILGHIAVAGLVFAGLLLAAPSGARRRLLLVGAYTALVVVVSDHVAGFFSYPPAYTAAFAALAVALSYAETRIEIRGSPLRNAGLAVAGLALVLCWGEGFAFKSFPRFKFLDNVRAREVLAEALPPGQKALVFAKHSPITVLDASYYGTPLGDARDRLCRAVEAFRSTRKLPPCDYAHVITEQGPAVVDLDIQNAMPVDEIPTVQAVFSARYKMLPPDLQRKYWPFLNGLVFRGQ